MCVFSIYDKNQKNTQKFIVVKVEHFTTMPINRNDNSYQSQFAHPSLLLRGPIAALELRQWRHLGPIAALETFGPIAALVRERAWACVGGGFRI